MCFSLETFQKLSVSRKKKKHPTRYTGQSVWQHGDVDPPMRKWNAWPTANAQNVLWWKHIELIPIQTTAQLLPYIPTVSTWLFLTNGGNDDKWESGDPDFWANIPGKHSNVVEVHWSTTFKIWNPKLFHHNSARKTSCFHAFPRNATRFVKRQTPAAPCGSAGRAKTSRRWSRSPTRRRPRGRLWRLRSSVRFAGQTRHRKEPKKKRGKGTR